MALIYIGTVSGSLASGSGLYNQIFMHTDGATVSAGESYFSNTSSPVWSG